jgi:hypothetical protein
VLTKTGEVPQDLTVSKVCPGAKKRPNFTNDGRTSVVKSLQTLECPLFCYQMEYLLNVLQF